MFSRVFFVLQWLFGFTVTLVGHRRTYIPNSWQFMIIFSDLVSSAMKLASYLRTFKYFSPMFSKLNTGKDTEGAIIN